MKICDFLIIGGGVIGLSVALELRQRYSDANIIVLEKEKQLAQHGSGRNSGVLHAGFYYSADSLKAKFTRDGNQRWKEFIATHGLAINQCGKLVVTKNRTEIEALHELKRRGDLNGVETQLISASEAREIEPRVRTTELALWSPTTASCDPLECMEVLANQAKAQKIEIMLDTKYRQLKYKVIQTNQESFEAGFVINCAGLQADQVAHDFGMGLQYRILPFKGL